MYGFVFYFMYHIYFRKLGHSAIYIGYVFLTTTICIHLFLIETLIQKYIFDNKLLGRSIFTSSIAVFFYYALILVLVLAFFKKERIKALIEKHATQDDFLNSENVLMFLGITVLPLILIMVLGPKAILEAV
jgi:hypothetical protein